MNQPSLFKKQLIASIIGIICMIVIMLIDYNIIKLFSMPAYIATLFLLVLVLIIARQGRDRYTGLAGLRACFFQPSELGRLSLP